MKGFKWLMGLSLIASIAYSGRELLAVARMTKSMTAPGGASMPAPGAQPAIAKGVAAEMGNLDLASKVADMNGSGTDGVPSAAPAQTAPAAAANFPRPDHAEAGDTNSAPGKIFAAKGGRDRASRPGGAVIMDANGNRLELVPTNRPKPGAAQQAITGLSKVELPTLDDPRASLRVRKLRAESALAACVLAILALAFWARKYKVG